MVASQLSRQKAIVERRSAAETLSNPAKRASNQLSYTCKKHSSWPINSRKKDTMVIAAPQAFSTEMVHSGMLLVKDPITM